MLKQLLIATSLLMSVVVSEARAMNEQLCSSKVHCEYKEAGYIEIQKQPYNYEIDQKILDEIKAVDMSKSQETLRNFVNKPGFGGIKDDKEKSIQNA